MRQRPGLRTPEPSRLLVDLVETAAAHGLGALERGEQLVPFLLTEGPRGRAVLQDSDARPEDCLALARWHAATCGPEVERLAVAFDGWLTVDGVRGDAVYVEAAEASGTTFRFAIRYAPRRRFRPARRLGALELLGTVEPLRRAA